MGVSNAQRNLLLLIADDLGSNWCGFQEDRVDITALGFISIFMTLLAGDGFGSK